jgi:ABC-type multidrug transport system ATPase subunit
MGEQLVETRELSKTYGEIRAVDRVSLTVWRGEVYGFLGLVTPTGGSASVHGDRPGSPRALARTGVLIEAPRFYPYLSGRDNLRVVARYAGVDDRRVETALETVDLAGRGGDRYAGYSLGMKQRLGVAAALLKDPELLILDEPTNGLDPAGMRDMRALLRDLGERGHTVLLSSHLLGEVQQLCDRVGVISGGRLLAESTVDDLLGQAGLLVRAEPLDKAREILERLVGNGNVAQADGSLRLRTAPELAGRVSRALADADVTLTELRPLERSLEEVFLEMTGTERTGR